jgi:ribosomal protein S18 acetylase RimI-like enzyme
MAAPPAHPLQSGVVVIVSAATAVTTELVDAVARLLPQLSRSARTPTAETLAEIIASPATTLFVARADTDGPIIGMLTLVLLRIPTAVRAWIEDVVVAEEARGRGCGEALSRAAIEVAAAAGARTVDLTSRPARDDANRLYQRIGFKPRETNVYRYELGS